MLNLQDLFFDFMRQIMSSLKGLEEKVAENQQSREGVEKDRKEKGMWKTLYCLILYLLN